MELLAPAGNLDKLKTAVLYGANAVYLAGQKFSLRGASDNFSETELLEGVLFARKNNCKTYVTLNAFLHDQGTERTSGICEVSGRVRCGRGDCF